MDGDLQDDPKEIPRFIEKINQGFDLVVGWKAKRKDPITKKIASKLFNLLIRLFTRVKVHDSNCCFKAYKKEVAKSISLYGELHRYIPSLAKWKGFRMTEIEVEHNKRKFGKSKYGVTRLWKGFLDLITVKFLMEYSNSPLYLFGSLGIVLSLLGFGTIIAMYIRKYLFGILIGQRQYLFILGVLAAILGIQFISLGLLGEMVVSSSRDKKYIIKEKI